MSIDINSLLSGLIGSVIGGVLALIGSLLATRISSREAIKRDEKRLLRELEQRRTNLKQHLLAEAKDNLELCKKVNVQHAKIRFLRDMWAMYKGDIDFLPLELQENLRKTYAQITRFNALADYDQADRAQAGSLDKDIEEQAQAVKMLVKELLPELEAQQ